MSTLVDFDQAVQHAEALEHERALDIYASAIEELRTEGLVQLASTSLLAAIAQNRRVLRRASSYRSLYRFLILQPGVPTPAPIFHYLLSSHHTSGVPNILPLTAREFDGVLAELWGEGCRSKNFLLMLLLLRESLATWISEPMLSRWHIDALSSFTRAEMSIPYNMMFDTKSFQKNVLDVAKVLEENTAVSLMERYTLGQIVRFQCMTRSGFLDQQMGDVLSWIEKRTAAGELPASEFEHARSLVLRASGIGHRIDPWSVRALGDGVLEEVVEKWCVLRENSEASTADETSAAMRRLRSRPWQAINVVRGLLARRGFSTPGRRKPRVAVCVSGQLRGYKRAHGTWRRGLLQGPEYMTFVHSWKRIGRSSAEPFRSDLPFEGSEFRTAYRNHAVRLGLEEMMSRYPRLFSTLSETGNVSEDDLCSFYETEHVVLENDAATEFADWSNARKMHYKIAACNELARKVGEFDLVLRIRPDKQLGFVAFDWGDLLASARSSSIIYADHESGLYYSDPMIGDQVAIGTLATMDRYSSTFQLVEVLGKMGAFGMESASHKGHVSLAATCWLSGIFVDKLPMKFGKLAEAEPLSSREILACIERDASGRMDVIDRDLLAAASADRRAP